MVKVLIAIDGSPAAEQALAMAGTLLAGKEAEVTLFHVIPRHLIYGGKGGPVVAESYDPAQEETMSRALLDGAEHKVSAAATPSRSGVAMLVPVAAAIPSLYPARCVGPR